MLWFYSYSIGSHTFSKKWVYPVLAYVQCVNAYCPSGQADMMKPCAYLDTQMLLNLNNCKQSYIYQFNSLNVATARFFPRVSASCGWVVSLRSLCSVMFLGPVWVRVGQWDGSVHKDICCQAWQPRLEPQENRHPQIFLWPLHTCHSRHAHPQYINKPTNKSNECVLKSCQQQRVFKDTLSWFCFGIWVCT